MRFRRKKQVLAALALLATSVLALTPAPATAAPAKDPAYERTVSPGQSFRVEAGDEEGTYAAGGLSDPVAVESATGDGLTTMALPAAYCSTWWEEEGTLVWKEKHTGKFCYNGRNVWITNSNYPNKDGYHYCDQGWAVGWTITVTKCDEYKGTASDGRVYLDNVDNFKTSYLFKGSPVTTSHWMKARAFEGGRIVFTGDMG